MARHSTRHGGDRKQTNGHGASGPAGDRRAEGTGRAEQEHGPAGDRAVERPTDGGDTGDRGGAPRPGPRPAAPRADSGPQKPTELPKQSWAAAAKRTATEFKKDNLTDWAAALTYYGILSIFPAILALVSILGLVGSSAIQPLLDNLSVLAPGPARDILQSMLTQLQDNQGRAGIALVVGIAVAVWSASGYVGAFMRAANAVYDIGEGRPAWKTLATRLATTLLLVILLAVSAVGVVFTGDLATRTGEVLGLGDTAVTVWSYAKWPVILLLVSLMIALLYWAAPNVKQAKVRWVSPGSALAVVAWIAVSALFALYVATFAGYDKTYGSLTAAIVFLIWLWLSNVAILFGLEFNAELERSRALRAGHPPEAEPYVEPRDTRKL